ncbi:hypothetical protein PMI32_02898 [Pseudomonas sp. GM60]|nr:hypothetical protein PMI32_02898 [Pseudomonas sp. GM60]
MAYLFKLTITARRVVRDDRNGVRRALCLLQEVHEYRAIGAILQIKRRIWAMILHLGFMLRMICTRLTWCPGNTD